jgi:hypothetical protein
MCLFYVLAEREVTEYPSEWVTLCPHRRGMPWKECHVMGETRRTSCGPKQRSPYVVITGDMDPLGARKGRQNVVACDR